MRVVLRGGFEPPTCPLGGGRAIPCATGAVGWLILADLYVVCLIRRVKQRY